MPCILQTRAANGRPVVTIGGFGAFSVEKTFDCGQCFRFTPLSPEALRPYFSDPSSVYAVSGVAFGKYVLFAEDRQKPGELIVVNAAPDECLSLWIPYLALDEDYDAIDRFLETALPEEKNRAVLRKATAYGKGVRILRQDPWETLISFIFSQNNNIPRIRKIIAAFCQLLGEETDEPGERAFPTPEAVLRAGLDGLAPIRAGFRAKYVLDAAAKVLSGAVDLAAVRAQESYDEALAMLRQIRGVGPKVGACALLFGFSKTEAFPVDVWMKKVLARRFPDGLDVAAFGKYAGVAQQYLFYYERYRGEARETGA